MSNDCIFCKIAANEVPSHKVYEDDLVVAILDIEPATKGHTLIIPKSHYHNMLEAPDDIVAKVSVLAKDLASNYKASLNCKGFYFMVAGVDVDHFHYHIVPRYHDNDIEFSYPNKPKDVDLAQVAADLRND